MRQKAEFQRFSQQVSQCKEISKELDISRMECVDRLQVVQKNLGIQTDPMASFMLPLGLQVSGIGRVISGEPVPVTTGLDLDGDGINLDRPVGLSPTVGRGNLDRPLSIINAYRASLNLPAFTADRLKPRAASKNIDLRITKQIALKGDRRVEVFAEAFNVTNVVNLYGGNSNIRLANFNVPTGALDARQVQWGLRYSF